MSLEDFTQSTVKPCRTLCDCCCFFLNDAKCRWHDYAKHDRTSEWHSQELTKFVDIVQKTMLTAGITLMSYQDTSGALAKYPALKPLKSP